MKIIYIYIVLINLLSFLLFGIDKYLAIKKKRRISEKTLILMMYIGGIVGSLLGMLFFHHKTKKIKFYIHIIISIIIWMYIILEMM